MADAVAKSQFSTRTPQEFMRDYIEGTLRGCEMALEKLGRPRDAGHTGSVVCNGTPRPSWLESWEAQEMLGWPDYQIDEAQQTTKLTALHELKARTRAIARAEKVTNDEARRRAIERDPKLYARHLREWQQFGPILRQRAAWRHAEMAALMAASLERLWDPTAMFAAGLAIGEYHQFNHQQNRLDKELLKAKAAARDRQRRSRVTEP